MKTITRSNASTLRSEKPAIAAPTQEQIRARAFQIYQMRDGNGVSGDDVSDWTRAEQQLKDERGVLLMKGDQE